jgi:ectoine hydroxylase-related dioxygenase (phytanoyl-CoA dioxygenase family)
MSDGWWVWRNAIPAEDIQAAEKALSKLFPTAEEMDAGTDDERTARWRDWDSAWPEFPFRSRSLNKLALHPALMDLAENLLGTVDVRLYMALITAKYAHQASGFNQLLHTDYPNHMIVVPRTDDGYRQLEMFVYLTDVSAENGATRLVSLEKTKDIPVERHTLNLTDYADLYDEPGEATGPAGSVVCYRPDVYHRSSDWEEPGRRRIMMHVSFRPAGAEWGGYHAWPYKGLSPDWHNFVQHSNPRELALLGFPEPGHPYWNKETLAGVGARYPDLDMEPWAAALRGSRRDGGASRERLSSLRRCSR